MDLECVINVSEGRDQRLLDALAAACGPSLLDCHSDPEYNRSVFTLAGPTDTVDEAARSLTRGAVAAIDMGGHSGVHPRFGAVDVVPFVPLVKAPDLPSKFDQQFVPPSQPTTRLAMNPALAPANAARDRFARWAGSELGLPCFLYGPLTPGGHRILPEVRRTAFRSLPPDTGPARPHPTAGAVAVGSRHFLVAYNICIDGASLELAQSVTKAIRGPAVRALTFDLGGMFQVSCNLIDPLTIGPAQIYDQIADLAAVGDASVERAELVGLLPAAVLAAAPRRRWPELGLRPELTIEARLDACGIKLQ